MKWTDILQPEYLYSLNSFLKIIVLAFLEHLKIKQWARKFVPVPGVRMGKSEL